MTVLTIAPVLEMADVARMYDVPIELLQPSASGRTSCDACGHLRKVHSRIGCVEQDCTCRVTYMDL